MRRGSGHHRPERGCDEGGRRCVCTKKCERHDWPGFCGRDEALTRADVGCPQRKPPVFSAMRGERGNGIAKIRSDGADAGIRAHPDTGMRVAVKWAAKKWAAKAEL